MATQWRSKNGKFEIIHPFCYACKYFLKGCGGTWINIFGGQLILPPSEHSLYEFETTDEFGEWVFNLLDACNRRLKITIRGVQDENSTFRMYCCTLFSEPILLGKVIIKEVTKLWKSNQEVNENE
jgi:hypothetical protein